MTAEIANAVGMLGVVSTLLAYVLLVTGKLSNHHIAYPLINIFGTLMIVCSLLYQWNLPSFIAQIAWIAISLVGLLRILRGARATLPMAVDDEKNDA